MIVIGKKSALFYATYLTLGALFLLGTVVTEPPHRDSTVYSKRSDEMCITDSDCGTHGVCKLDKNVYGDHTNVTSCECEENYITFDGEQCDYELRSRIATFLISLFIGSLGVDYCFLARGSGLYICLGILKGVTLGGCGVWWIVNWVMIAASSTAFPDGNDQPLSEW